MRFSDAEWVLLRGCAGSAGVAVGAWLGQLAVTAADPSAGAGAGGVGLQDLLRLHADVVVLQQAALCAEGGPERAAALDVLLARVTDLIDAVVAQMGRG